ncbi:MAG: precorrin-6A reductase [Ruminococcus sp.]|nr:precorrin-6A reductase [Ruminococcus sp.]
MYRLLIFGGTTEGRLLAEYCGREGISADVSVATDYGASLVPEGVRVICGRLDAEQMKALIGGRYSAVVDATHPYAVEATENIRRACTETGTEYLRLIRKSSEVCGRTVQNMEELTELLNAGDDIILSTLGSKSLPELTKVRNYRERIWVRVLPSEKILEQCRELGYDEAKVIMEKGPFSAEQNARHLRKSGAGILLTKESGATGGYPEKAEAAQVCGAEIVTLIRPAEQGYSFEEIIKIIEKEMKQ